MKNKDLEIGESYEFSLDEEFTIIEKGRLIYIHNEDIYLKYVAVLDEQHEIKEFSFIRPIQKIKSNFIETDVYIDSNGIWVCKRPDEKICTLNSAISYGAVGFKFKEHKKQIFNSPIIYINKKDSAVFTQAVVSENNSFEIIRADKVVWLKPNYKK